METFKFNTASRTVLGDLFTPVGVYLRLRDLYPQSALMECSDYHDATHSRSFIGIDPLASVAVAHGEACVKYPDGTTKTHEVTGDFSPSDAIHALIDNINIQGENKELFGLFGYTSFNSVRYLEPIDVKDETQEKNDAPDILYILFRTVIAFDHHSNRLTAATLGSEETLDEVLRMMNRSNVQTYDFHPDGEASSTLTDEEHKANIRRGIAHCKRGDVFQLRSINPSPYLFYFDFGGFRIFGSSPETHCRIEGRRAYIDPIAGTTRRTGDAEADRKGAEFLRNDPKATVTTSRWTSTRICSITPT